MNLLGKSVSAPSQYAPEILHPIPRSIARGELGLEAPLPFHGDDLWHAWELAWLDGAGQPRQGVGRFRFPVTTANLVESKSFKLYLGSLYNSRFDTVEALCTTLTTDLSAVADGAVQAQLLQIDDPALAPTQLPGHCIDQAQIDGVAAAPDAGLLEVDRSATDGTSQYSHGLRSLCPVTGQPDWATVLLQSRGGAVSDASLRAYIASFREHQEYHEQCVERMFRDLAAAGLEDFSIHALYTRRGGMDINPWRSTAPGIGPALRTQRQ